jgi:hypothetical protein
MKVGPDISEVVTLVNKMVLLMMMFMCGGVCGEIFAFNLVSGS